MKKTLIGVLQVLSYFVIYEIVVFAIYSLFGLLINVINRIPILKIIITDLCAETLMFTICPLVSSVIIVLAMGFLFKKTGIYLVPLIIMFMVLSYTNISNIINTAFTFGIISWDFANVLWQSVILCGIIIWGLLNQSIFYLKLKGNSNNE